MVYGTRTAGRDDIHRPYQQYGLPSTTKIHPALLIRLGVLYWEYREVLVCQKHLFRNFGVATQSHASMHRVACSLLLRA